MISSDFNFLFTLMIFPNTFSPILGKYGIFSLWKNFMSEWDLKQEPPDERQIPYNSTTEVGIIIIIIILIIIPKKERN